MNAWTNKCYRNYYEMVLDLISESHISIRLPYLNMHSWHVDHMFSVCLMKCFSWLDWLGQFLDQVLC